MNSLMDCVSHPDCNHFLVALIAGTLLAGLAIFYFSWRHACFLHEQKRDRLPVQRAHMENLNYTISERKLVYGEIRPGRQWLVNRNPSQE